MAGMLYQALFAVSRGKKKDKASLSEVERHSMISWDRCTVLLAHNAHEVTGDLAPKRRHYGSPCLGAREHVLRCWLHVRECRGSSIHQK